MRNALVVFVTAALLIGCSVQQNPEPQTASPAAVEMDGKWIVALGATRLGPKHLEPPDASDRAYAKQLPEEVVQRCIAFLDKGGSIKPTPNAARRVGAYILVCLEYKGGPSDSNRFVVYSTADKKVIGEFVWHKQP